MVRLFPTKIESHSELGEDPTIEVELDTDAEVL